MEEASKNKKSSLNLEVKILKTLEGKPGIPRVIHQGMDSGYNFMVIDLLGPNLEDMLNCCKRKFSLKTTIMLID